MPGLALQVLGPFAATVDEQPFDGLHIRPTVALCVYLTCRPERHRRERLMALLWPDWPPAAAHKNLRQALYTLRQALPDVAARDGRNPVPLVLADRETLQLNPDASVDLDINRFSALLRENTPEATAAAVDLYRGDFLADFYLPDSAPFEEWVAALRGDLRRLMLDALDRLAAHALEHDAPEEAATCARRQLALDNLRESAYRQLMRALATLGQRAEALAQYELCAHLLRVELDMEPSAETRELAGRIAGGETDLITPDASGAKTYPVVFAVTPRHNLPLELSSFIGREREISDVQRLLGASRLVTLTGAGGCGKSRLSLEAAHGRLAAYPDGTWLIELAPLSNPDLVLQTIAYTIGLRDQSGRLLQEALTDYLRSRNTLLVLDNCEHLIETCAAFSEALLRACPRLHILATSREALAVTGETLYVVPSLQLPEPDQQPGEMADVESVRLFVERATAARPGFELTDCNAVAVAQICRRLDGIPLAIELAAARVKALSAAQIADRLDDRFQFLTAGSRTALPRQQTLRATIDWSYNLLSEPERRLFRRLAVFRGGWTLEAAEAVCTGPDLTGFGNLSGLDVLDLLGHLVDKSLVMAKEADGVIRYSRLETIRQYGCEKLEESGELEQMRRRHLDYFLDFAERGDRGLRGPHSLEWTRRMDFEHYNLRVALEYAFSVEEYEEIALRLTHRLYWFWRRRAYFGDAFFWIDKALNSKSAMAKTPIRARLLFDYGTTIMFIHGDSDGQRAALEESLEIFQTQGESHGVEYLYVLAQLGRELFYFHFFEDTLEASEELRRKVLDLIQDSDDKWASFWALATVSDLIESKIAIPWLKKGLSLFYENGDRYLVAEALFGLGKCNIRQGNFTEAKEYLEKALAIHREFGNITGTSSTLLYLGDAAYGLNEYDQAESCYREGLFIHIQAGLGPDHLFYFTKNLGLTALHRGDVEHAISYIKNALDMVRGRKHFWIRPADCMLSLGFVHAVRQRGDVAARLFGAYDSAIRSITTNIKFINNLLFGPEIKIDMDWFQSLVRVQLDNSTYEALFAEGQRLSLDEAITYALRELE